MGQTVHSSPDLSRRRAVRLDRDQGTGFLGPLCSVSAIRPTAPLEEEKKLVPNCPLCNCKLALELG